MVSIRSKFTVDERRTIPNDLVALVQEELRQVRAVLPGYARDKRSLRPHR